MNPAPPPLVVDLDGTLTPVDTLHELGVAAFLAHPFQTLRAFRELRRGRAEFKARLAKLAPAFPRALPLNGEVVKRLQESGSPVSLLCTASTQSVADKAAALAGGFTEARGSDEQTNLKGTEKARFLVGRYGESGYTYIGNSRDDLPVWSAAGRAVVVSRDEHLIAEARRCCREVEVLRPARVNGLGAVITSLRPHQWVKNLLVFLPLLASHSFAATGLWLGSVAACASLCLLASSAYLLNDVLDVDADRGHPTKAKRPVAAGRLGVFRALLWAGALAAAGLGLCLAAAPDAAPLAGLYLAVTLLYSRWLKRVPFLDAAVLAVLYTLRVWAGSAVTGIWPTGWLTGFSLSLFVSLALCKRYVEYGRLPEGETVYSRRGYAAGHLPAIRGIGVVAMLGAAGILAAYLTSENVARLYRHPWLLLVAVGIVAGWGLRMWARAGKGTLDDDPVAFALKDPLSWGALGALGVTFLGAM
ncbi:UbiA family prenyltransferase [Nibricoccus sp. IMCC34717]|uniref:UbiA family prenyltransferase n=1 Tax=Nibricoccus sp. IMCC34717 TaxID=3034021 RepID=UPI00384B97C5